MKNNKMMRIAAVILMMTLLTTCAISGTFAKYTASASGEDTARVAKWDITYNSGNLEDTITFGLFDTAKIGDTKTSAADDTNVKNAANASDAAIIAPGTTGSFTFTISNKSEVTAQYKIDYTVTNSGIPIEYSVDNGLTWTTDLADVEFTNLTIETGTAEITIQWRWAFTGDASAKYTLTQTDTSDTNLGIAGTPAQVTVSAQITVEQVD